ncbi:transforming growth factor beta receptor type 3-like [Tachypleus tridentatus]|uniref:transforming growth factor beta receptor type 3-like n=1 Tax=Tachypleus tridentatus TaxID=6853 RepID=UPI003FD38085
MHLYKDSDFHKKLLRVNGLLEVLSQDNVYVKTAIEAGPDLFVVTDECWLSLTNNSLVITENREVLIQHSCPKHLSVGLLGVEHHGSRSPEELSYQQRFFFHFTQRWIGHKVFLHCHLAVCSDKANSPLDGVKQCIDPKDYCVGNDAKQVSESRTEQHFSVQVEGPIYVLPSRETRGKDANAPFLFNYLPVMDKNLDRISPVVKSDIRAGSCSSHVMMELSTAAVVGIAFASFLIGAGLVVVLWFIHLHTDPSQRTRAQQQRDVRHRHRHHHSGCDLSGHSGSSTPSSQAPMTVHACA